MAPKVRSLIGPPAAAPGGSPTTALTFPADLIHPPQSQLAHSEDAVSDRVARLDASAKRLGEAFGISFTTFILNPVSKAIDGDPAKAMLAILSSLIIREERVSLERRGGRWGLYFTREPSVIAQERRTEAVLLKDAPLDVRERFLLKSEEFFRSYLKLCEDRLGQMRTSVVQADQTLELLDGLRLD